MRVSGILSIKGSDVATIRPEESVEVASEQLHVRRIGALVVTGADGTLRGIISERDIVHAVAKDGPKVLSKPVDSIMTTDVWTCSPNDSAEDLMRTMTDHRARHIPVVVDGALAGLVSIGDVVKSRLTELEDQAQHLHDYITTGR